MKLSEVQIGETYTYFPPKMNAEDNRHWPAKVEAIKKRVRVRVFMEGSPADGVVRNVSADRLSIQGELL